MWLLEELNQALRQPLAQHLPDQRLADPRLEAFDLYVGDGHWHAAAVHDPVQQGTKFATGHLFGLDLRAQGAFHLTVGDQQTWRKEHDMRGLKRLEVETLRQGAPRGEKSSGSGIKPGSTSGHGMPGNSRRASTSSVGLKITRAWK